MLKTVCSEIAALQGQNAELRLQLKAANVSNWAVAEAEATVRKLWSGSKWPETMSEWWWVVGGE